MSCRVTELLIDCRDPKALAAFCFKLADAFEQATNETPRKLAEIEARNKASVKLDEVDVSSFIKK